MQERAQQTRAAILAAARAAFAEGGLEGARIDDIAARAGANKQRIYANFGSKEGLFAAVVEEAVAALAACEAAVLPAIEAEPARIGELLLDAYLVFLARDEAFWRLLAWANLAGLAPRRQGARKGTLERLAAAFAQARTQGGVPADAEFAAWLLTLTAVVFFLAANRRTAGVSLGVDLASAAARERLARQALALIVPH